MRGGAGLAAAVSATAGRALDRACSNPGRSTFIGPRKFLSLEEYVQASELRPSGLHGDETLAVFTALESQHVATAPQSVRAPGGVPGDHHQSSLRLALPAVL